MKYANKELRGMLQTVEEKMTDEFINQEIPEEFQEIYRRRLFEGKDDTIEGELLAIADKVDLLYESFDEISKNNPEKVYREMFIESILTIKEFDHRASVNYFFDFIFPELLNQEFFGKEEFLADISAALQRKKRTN
ncbi:hypothetical protein K4E_19530 [Enterococcus thailandicus]|nr:hypothetical protein K4E_19530 [Enterococcus thailandicus]